MANEMKKMIRMMASDGKEVVVEEAVAMKSEIIRHMIEDNFTEDVIPIPNVTASVLSNIFDYCKKHMDFLPEFEELEDFDNKFVDIDTDALYDLIMVNNYPSSSSNYLGVKDLIDLICKKVANIIRWKTPEEIRQIFKIENDFTPEEEEKIRKEHAWAFE
ncbi:SKP1-like protein 4 [Dendrobium catenatum]|uniref:SKP1-like protein n=1 Tax=Dendrobium catenatum TaxID=906689 RepID=A0A2I0WPD6_9ASPA|nr:SKP1-like protein 4 [Dendrobium catenatum]